ncbi:MAG: radical SAM protein [Nanoarchaeota archaeon]
MIKKTPYHSFARGSLAKGCRLCVQGKKMVLFVTGICDRGCFYCPLSDNKRGRDILIANEWDTGFAGGKVSREQLAILFKEAELTDAKGAGITGGDPLLVNERTVCLIKALKKRFGAKFHVHLYTSLRHVTLPKLSALAKAGLDEIRFHPVIWGDPHLDRILLAKKFSWDIGVEIPAIPDYEKQTRLIMDWLDGKVSFLNLNELEVSDTNAQHLAGRGFHTKSQLSYGIKGSQELALRLMRYAERKKHRYAIHYCTCTLKDAVQMASRLKRRAKNAALPTDKVTKEGMLVRGVVYLKQLQPGFGYRKRLKAMTKPQRQETIRRLEAAQPGLGFASAIDDFKLRLLAAEKDVREHAAALKKKGLIPAVVEEYPTHDGMEVQIDFLH